MIVSAKNLCAVSIVMGVRSTHLSLQFCEPFCRYESKEGDFPQILRHHSEEIRMWKSKVKKYQDGWESNKRQLEGIQYEVERLKERNRKLEMMNKKKHLDERESLAATVEEMKKKLEERDKRIVVSWGCKCFVGSIVYCAMCVQCKGCLLYVLYHLYMGCLLYVLYHLYMGCILYVLYHLYMGCILCVPCYCRNWNTTVNSKLSPTRGRLSSFNLKTKFFAQRWNNWSKIARD